METIYDWITVIIFGAITVLYLHRSSQENPPDRVYHYLPPSGGCVLANQLGNSGQMLLAIAIIASTLLYVVLVLKPKLTW